MEKPRIRLLFKFKSFFEARLLNRYESIGLGDDINEYKVRKNWPYIDGLEPQHHNILNKTGGTAHYRK